MDLEQLAPAVGLDAGQLTVGGQRVHGAGDFVVYPTHRLVKARKVRNTTRRLRSRLADYHAGLISFAELDAGFKGWINHVSHADSWGLRGHVLGALPIRSAEHRRAAARRY